jgi:predicted dehydrogenase
MPQAPWNVTPSEETMRIVFIGTGGIARSHADGLIKRSDVTFAGAYDAAPERAQSFVRQPRGDAGRGEA